MQDLNTMLPPTSGRALTDAVGIDASGQIVAFGTDASGASTRSCNPRTPARPEPTTLALFEVRRHRLPGRGGW